MTINMHGLEHYQSHQKLGQTDTARTSVAGSTGSETEPTGLTDDAVSLSDTAAVVEWIAHQAPDLAAGQAADPANLGRLSEHLLHYDLVSVPEAGRLMSLADAETSENNALNGRIKSLAADSQSRQEKQQWQKLDRLVSNLTAAQTLRAH